jgi:CCR4-NOT transcriptional complex subunit CAF120
VSQLPGFRDSHSRTSSVSSTASPVSSSPSPASSAATSPAGSPPSSSPHQKASPPSPRLQERLPLSVTSSPASATEPFPDIVASPELLYEPSTRSAGSSSPIEPIPEDDDGVAPLVNVSRSNSGGPRTSRSAQQNQTAASATAATTSAPPVERRQRGYSVASNYSGRERSSSRPSSFIQAYQPPVMDISDDTPAELQPTFTLLNNHGGKLYQEGYFLKLDDQNAQGRANPDRTWHECFAQLVGTVLSFWDAAELDAAGDDGEVLPKYINITDASIKMIESLKMSTGDSQELQNVLSISTAGRNRYLLHFNSHHALIQWTSAIRLALFEHSSLQEAYTGALIAGKARALNNINIIMERAVVPSEDWVRVRFGAGVPWRRCWCVITPPSIKDVGRAQKEMKKRSPYDRSAPVLKGDIKFYDSRRGPKA